MKKSVFVLLTGLLILNVLAVAVLADDGASADASASASTSAGSDKPVPTLYGADNASPTARPMGILAQARNETMQARQEMRNQVRANITSEREAFRNDTRMMRNETREQLAEDGGLRNMTAEQRAAWMNQTREMQKERVSAFNDMLKQQRYDMREGNSNMIISALSPEQKSIIAGKINAKTGLNLSAEDIGNGTAGQELRAYLSNGNFARIKVLPDEASKKALERLQAKCDVNNCSVELKEVGFGNDTRAAYEVATTKHARLFGIFGANMAVNAQVDAQTGDVIATKKPWWAFLAREDNANESDIADSVGSSTTVPENTTVTTNVTASVNASADTSTNVSG